jgi:hypothetical protein
MDGSDSSVLERRVLRLEEELDLLRAEFHGNRDETPFHPAWALGLGATALASGYVGLGLPRHYYPPLFAGLLLLLLYHRGFLRRARGGWHWLQVIVNFFVLVAFFTFLIGGGTAHPFEWLKVPVIAKAPAAGDGAWYRLIVPDLSVQWQAVPKVSDWSLDITKVQTLLMIATLAGALFRFQPFTSITALALLVVSIPAYLAFNWDWVVLFLIVGSLSLYLQTAAARGRNPR